jgi:hypothetical protein
LSVVQAVENHLPEDFATERIRKARDERTKHEVRQARRRVTVETGVLADSLEEGSERNDAIENAGVDIAV